MPRHFAVPGVTAALLCMSVACVLAAGATSTDNIVKWEMADAEDIQYDVFTTTADTVGAATLGSVTLTIIGTKPNAKPMVIELGPIKMGRTQVEPDRIPKVNIGYPCKIELKAKSMDGWKAQSVEIALQYNGKPLTLQDGATIMKFGGDNGIGWIDLGGCGDGLINLARLPKAEATQCGTYGGYGPVRAIDGNTSGDAGVHSFAHTDGSNPAWWQVKLPHTAMVRSIQLWPRTGTDVVGNPTNYTVSLLQDNGPGQDVKTIWSETYTPTLSRMREIIIEGELAGNVVRVALVGQGLIALAEVEVIGSEHMRACPQNARWYPDFLDDMCNAGWRKQKSR